MSVLRLGTIQRTQESRIYLRRRFVWSACLVVQTLPADQQGFASTEARFIPPGRTGECRPKRRLNDHDRELPHTGI
jgi:hypothetical protein